ncbi:MAG TPA: 3D domain-containing protein [Gaiellaceae bacterium]|jgi:3D (Asp-Asp-Asp) domain-containing protein
MLRGRRYRAARFGGLAAALALTAASAALAAPGVANKRDSGGGDGTTQQLDSQAHTALLSLYSLDSRLEGWRARLASLEHEAGVVRRQRGALRGELRADRASLRVGRRSLAINLRALYERGDVNAMAVMLGANSLTRGLKQLDDLSQVADESRQIVSATRTARHRLVRSRQLLAAEERRLDRALAGAQDAERRLTATIASRRAYISSLRARATQAAQVQSVTAAAQTAEQKSQPLQPVTSSPVTGKRQLVVSATCYDLSGRTATGMPVGQGVVAVDPSVIPLGTRMYVPGYGNGVAADVGSGIQGASIDLWMTPSQCAAWGRRTVTITLS